MKIIDNIEIVDLGLYLKKQKTLIVSDLHIGYEQMMHEEGIMFPLDQLGESINEVKSIFEELNKRKQDVEKVILLGDLKHYFKFMKKEKFDVLKFIDFLRNYVKDENIIIIKGNHDKIEVGGRKFVNFYQDGEIIFIHGDRIFNETYDEGVKLIVMGHIHPSIVLKDEQEVKKERYKCFLKGKFMKKEVFIVPSFLEITKGILLEEMKEDYSIIDKKKLKDFEVFVVNRELGEEALGFGKLKDL